MKKITSLLLVVLMLMSCLCVYSTAAEEIYATIATASDFQGSYTNANNRLAGILQSAKKDGVTVNAALFGGDYSSDMNMPAGKRITEIRSTVKSVYPSVKDNTMLFVQGNHDLDSANFAVTGLHDMGSFLVYSMNEDEYYRPQGGSSYIYGMFGIQNCADKLNTALTSLVSKGEKRPVMVITHVPLHHSSRSSYSDTLYSKYVFDVINTAAKKLDIIFLFGHNHSSAYDDYIGGAVNYLAKGSTIRIPVPSQDAAGESGYTKEKLNFTYMNCGYVGYSNNGATGSSTNTLTASFIQLAPSTITVKRYTTDGLYSTKTISKINQTTSASTVSKDKTTAAYTTDTYMSGVTELEDGHHYIIGRDFSGTEDFTASAAKAEVKYIGKSTYMGLKDREISAEYKNGHYITLTNDAAVVYAAKVIDGKTYLKNVDNGLYLSTVKSAADSVYTSGRTDIVLVDESKLDSNAVCTVSDGMLKVGKYFINHSSSCYFYAKSSGNVILLEGTLTEDDINKPEVKQCSHFCHDDGFLGFIWMLIRPIIELLGIMKTCSCGVAHY